MDTTEAVATGEISEVATTRIIAVATEAATIRLITTELLIWGILGNTVVFLSSWCS